MFMTIAFLFGMYSGWMLRKNRDTVLKFFKLQKEKNSETTND